MGFRIRHVATAGVLAIAVAVSGCESACSSAVLAPTHPEAALLPVLAPLPRVVVEQGKFPPIYAERLAEALRASKVFSRVDLAGAGASDAPLVATVTAPSEGAAVIPIFTALTLGFFPTWAEETWGLRFALAAKGSDAPPVEIDFRWRGTTFLGWVSALLNLAPGRGDTPNEGPRYAAHVAASIAPHAAVIEALASHP